MRSRVAGVVVLAALGASTALGCDGGADEGVSRDAQVYVATIRDILAAHAPSQEPDVLPIVYVVGVGETKIPADVQAEVAVELDEDADIRFADQRAEAVLEDKEDLPVRDHGLLLAVGELAPESDPVEVDVEVYRSDDDWSKVVLTVARRSSQWTVTSSSVLPLEQS